MAKNICGRKGERYQKTESYLQTKEKERKSSMNLKVRAIPECAIGFLLLRFLWWVGFFFPF